MVPSAPVVSYHQGFAAPQKALSSLTPSEALSSAWNALFALLEADEPLYYVVGHHALWSDYLPTKLINKYLT